MLIDSEMGFEPRSSDFRVLHAVFPPVCKYMLGEAEGRDCSLLSTQYEKLNQKACDPRKRGLDLESEDLLLNTSLTLG